MFAALKILGKTVEFVQVDGENHGIVGYQKRIGWQKYHLRMVRQMAEKTSRNGGKPYIRIVLYKNIFI